MTEPEMETPMASTFTLTPQGLELRFRKTTLAHREWVTDSYVRVRLQGDDLRGFDSPGSDDHIRVFFPEGDPATVEELRATPSREYTPLAWGEDWLDLEFAIHGDEGVAAPWAAKAPLGSLAGVGGPRGSKVLHGRPDAWFLAGDETAVPAMRRFARLMHADAIGHVLVEVTDAAHELPIQTPSGVGVEFVHRGAAPSGSALAARLGAVTAHERPEGSVFGFIAAEQSIVKPGRALLLDRWGLDADSVIVKGYWKRGEDEYHAPH
ncbi:siderophore-interacting protein [Microbacterium sp. C7(2022)]|uniref:siderophore-interacting protein n=1 Tax=Microbacterium sp. C7(2022) TaxID=2992759 RepID=UPI00237B7F68|nr:siderophore-interacting protein [Microbacterium sp. C7(2022)]MDE0546209.1 siderophore-interacting protein [Microbacterium sp. C7(2022)]